ncbi:MAG TPA: hypothetical protein VGC72_05550 [Candidatus Elarobacter sp.]|jgi:hypothetical protein
MRRISVSDVAANAEWLCNDVGENRSVYAVVLRYDSEPTVLLAPVALHDTDGEEWLDPVGPIRIDPDQDQPFEGDDEGSF